MARQMKDSGIEWIGDIPETWQRDKVVRTFSLIGSGTTPKSTDEEQYGGTINWIQSGDINGGVMSSCKNTITEQTLQEYSALKVYQAPFIILAMYGASVGNLSISTIDGCVNQACCVLSMSKCNFKYAFYTLKAAKEYLLQKAVGGGQPNISQDIIRSLWIPQPELEEQQRIAAFLDRKCAEIDAVIERTKATIEEYKKLKQAVITEAVTKSVRSPRPMKDSGIEWIGEIPEGWEVVQIKHLKAKTPNSFVDGPFGSNLKSIHYVDDGDVYVVESGFITTGKFVYKKFKTITAEHFETIKRSECKGKDIIIAKIGANFGMAAELPELDKPSVVSGNSLKITLNQALILNSIFVYELSMAKSHGGYVGLYNETAQPALSLSSLNSFKLVVAPMVEQQEIESYLDEKCAALDTLIAKKTALLTELETYKKSLIYEYVTGKKEV